MTTDQPPGQSGISLWTAEFFDPFTEAAYRKRNAGFNIRHTRIGLTLWGVLLILFISMTANDGWIESKPYGSRQWGSRRAVSKYAFS